MLNKPLLLLKSFAWDFFLDHSLDECQSFEPDAVNHSNPVQSYGHYLCEIYLK